MWDGLFMLLVLSVVMTVASFLAGALPLAFSLSTRQLRLITAVGTGVLVGTSLIVIIPEGVESLYSARNVQSTQVTTLTSLSPRSAAPVAWTPSDLAGDKKRNLVQRDDDFSASSLHTIVVRQTLGHRPTGPDDGNPEGPAPGTQLDSKLAKDITHDWEPHAWVGVSLILGFILMYLIDKLPRHASGSSQPKPSYISLNRFTLRRTGTQEANQNEGDEEDVDTIASAEEESNRSRPSSTTVGLVIHAAADGIALGASSTGSSKRLGFVVFLALMIHKAPAAFGLTSALLKQGLSKRRARTHLIIFSLAAPTGALLTWAVANMFGGGRFGGGEGGSNTEFATGVLLLFSGGTFLYVAMHTMQDSTHHNRNRQYPSSQNGGYGETAVYDGYQTPAPKVEGPGLTETLATVVGMLLPLLTQFGHVH